MNAYHRLVAGITLAASYRLFLPIVSMYNLKHHEGGGHTPKTVVTVRVF